MWESCFDVSTGTQVITIRSEVTIARAVIISVLCVDVVASLALPNPSFVATIEWWSGLHKTNGTLAMVYVDNVSCTYHM